jgi:hypothetical protein
VDVESYDVGTGQVQELWRRPLGTGLFEGKLSPDGRQIANVYNGKLILRSLEPNAPEVDVAPLSDSADWMWNEDGSAIYAVEPLFVGDTHDVTGLDFRHILVDPIGSPEGLAVRIAVDDLVGRNAPIAVHVPSRRLVLADGGCCGAPVGRLWIVDMSNGQVLQTIATDDRLRISLEPLVASRDGSRVAFVECGGCRDHEPVVKVLDVASGDIDEVGKLERGFDVVGDPAFSDDGTWLAWTRIETPQWPTPSATGSWRTRGAHWTGSLWATVAWPFDDKPGAVVGFAPGTTWRVHQDGSLRNVADGTEAAPIDIPEDLRHAFGGLPSAPYWLGWVPDAVP